MSSYEPMTAERFAFPTSEYPCYHIVLVPDFDEDHEVAVTRIEANGKWVRDFIVCNDGVFSPKRRLLPGARPTIYARADWKNGENVHVSVHTESDNGNIVRYVAETNAPEWGGYWNEDWKYYASVLLSENLGIARENEPVHVTLGVYADRLRDPVKEVRVVRIDPVSGVAREVPSQVTEPTTWAEMSDERCQPTTTFDVAFLADVPAYSQVVYCVFYGNSKAVEPTYATDLQVSGEGLALTVDNAYYQVKLHDLSGVIDEITLKQGVNAVFDHHLETNGCVHWNPCVYAPPRSWLHTSDWNPPENHKNITGPIFTVAKRWGPMPHYPEINCDIQYIFYAHNPYVLVSTTTHVKQDMDVVALRHGEFVFNHNVIKEFAWKEHDGAIGSVVIKDRPRHPEPGLEIAYDTPWWALYNQHNKAAIGLINMDTAHIRIGGGKERTAAYTYLHWGPWVYVARPLIYSFIGNNPQRVQRAHGNSIHYEKQALFPFRLAEDELFDPIELQTQQLKAPLEVECSMDTDERVPVEWVPPILVEEFEELED